MDLSAKHVCGSGTTLAQTGKPDCRLAIPYAGAYLIRVDSYQRIHFRNLGNSKIYLKRIPGGNAGNTDDRDPES